MESSLSRESPARAVHISGVIDDQLVGRLTPAITALRVDAPQPITVYIDSLGGSTYYADALVRLLRAPTQDGQPCPLTTVVTTVAASAGADLLAAGDYAIAFPGATVHYHGTRRSAEGITIEKAAQLAGDLHRANEKFALRLAKRVVARLLFVFSAHRSLPSNSTKDSPSPAAASPVEVLIQIFTKALDSSLVQTVHEATKLQRQTRTLVQEVEKLLANLPENEPRVEVEARILKAILDYELKRKDRGQEWSLHDGGIDELRTDFLQLVDYLGGSHRTYLQQLIKDYGVMLLDAAELAEFKQRGPDLPDSAQWLAALVEPRMEEFWYFVICLCRGLQRGEHSLSAKDAYWLGLVDEVLGSDLPCIRLLYEQTKSSG